ncbi:M48 family metalloprotease [Desulfobacula sp.]|uniref:M48 family metalloprotease n=1 Tax=Desulfobacula sp. TaxID=2593537 RepID=UPI0026130C5F|nr:M48 family metalloprotease [Desulfobacula sp.]
MQLATEAGIDVIKAATLSDGEVKLIATMAAKQSDSKNHIAGTGNPYGMRLKKLVGNRYNSDGYVFDFKVYWSSQINAFAMADETIRIYSGLMDMMNDEELLFVVGHEMGHVVEKHIKKKIMLAYST